MSWKKEKKKGRKIEERTKFVHWYSSWMRAEYARSWGEKSRRLRDRQCNRIIRTGYRLSILIHTYIYIHAYIYIYTHHCAFISGPYRPIPVGNCPLLCVTSPLKTIHVPRNLASTSLPSSLLLPHLHMNPNWAWGMVVVVGRRCGGW